MTDEAAKEPDGYYVERFGPYDPPMLSSWWKGRLFAHEDVLDALQDRVKNCMCCLWCARSICSEDQPADWRKSVCIDHNDGCDE